MDAGRRSKSKERRRRDKKRKNSVRLHANVVQVEDKVKQLLIHVKDCEDDGDLDSDLISIRTELQSILKEVHQLE